MLEIYLDMLELGYFEIGVAFEGLADANVWRRPAEGMLSVGEIAGHIAYAEATRLGGVKVPVEDGTATSDEPRITSPLIDSRFAYSPITLTTEPTPEQLAMTAEDVFREVMRVHVESVALLRARNPNLDSLIDGWHEELSHRENLKYMIFHIAYHTGQIYATRHLLGEETVSN